MIPNDIISNDTRIIDVTIGQLTEIMADKIIRKITKQQQPIAEPDLMRIAQAAKMLDLDKSTLYTKCSRREVPHIKKGKFLWFSRADLNAWLREGNRKSKQQIEAEAEEDMTERKQK